MACGAAGESHSWVEAEAEKGRMCVCISTQSISKLAKEVKGKKLRLWSKYAPGYYLFIELKKSQFWECAS